MVKEINAMIDDELHNYMAAHGFLEALSLQGYFINSVICRLHGGSACKRQITLLMTYPCMQTQGFEEPMDSHVIVEVVVDHRFEFFHRLNPLHHTRVDLQLSTLQLHFLRPDSIVEVCPLPGHCPLERRVLLHPQLLHHERLRSVMRAVQRR